MSAEAREQVTITRELHFPNFDLYKRSDGIVVLTSGDTAWITIKEAKGFVDAMHEITGGTPHPLLFIPGRHASIDKEARAFMATAEALQDIVARATVPSSVAHRIIGQVHQTIDQPAKPVKLFDNITEAVVWLKKQAE